MADRRLLTTYLTTISLPPLLFAGVAAASPPPKTTPTGDKARASIPIRVDRDATNAATPPAAQLTLSKSTGLVPTSTPRWRHITVHSGDTLSQIFQQVGLDSASWRSVLALGGRVGVLKRLNPGDEIALEIAANGKLRGLRYRLGQVETLRVTRRANGDLRASVDALPQTTRRRVVRGRVVKSLPNSLARARVPARIANQLATIFKNRDSLTRHVQPGDQFTLLYQTRYSGGEQTAAGPIVAASITTRDARYRAFRARNALGNYNYYDSNGRSFKRFISRHPVDYTRISSPFSHSRVNPVTGRREPHNGVDMAAPTGTPVHAAAAGTIKFEGWEHGYGRLVKIKSLDGYSTRYAHMHGFADSLGRGDHVQRGEVIGYVGQTGRTTGPHLHFEIRKDGEPHNPMTMPLPSGQKLSPSRLKAFRQRIKPLVAKLDGTGHRVIAARDKSPANPNSCVQRSALSTALGINPLAVAEPSGGDNGHFYCIRKS